MTLMARNVTGITISCSIMPDFFLGFGGDLRTLELGKDCKGEERIFWLQEVLGAEWKGDGWMGTRTKSGVGYGRGYIR